MSLEAFLDYLAEDRRSRDLAEQLVALVVLRFGIGHLQLQPALVPQQQAS